MGVSCLSERLGRRAELSEAERAALQRAELQVRTLRRGAIAVREGDPSGALFLVRSGWLHGSTVLGNGTRQILRFLFPGDLLGLSVFAMAEWPETLTCVSDVELVPLSRERLVAALMDHPRLATLLVAHAEAGRLSLADRLSSIGRTPARARIAWILCEVADGMRRGSADFDGNLRQPPTQEEIGDATGLTAVHVNRMMRSLAAEGLIGRQGTQLRILNEPELRLVAGFTPRETCLATWVSPLT